MTTCPICKKDDQIQKVISIWQSGTSSGTFSGPTGGLTALDGKVGTVGGYTSVTGTSSTRLARILAPPASPVRETYRGHPTALIIFISFFVSAFICNGISSNVDTFSGFVTGAILMALGVIVAVIVGESLSNKFDANHDEAYNSSLRLWQKHYAVYERLYYCHRDNIVYDPESNQYTEPGSKSNLYIY